MTVGREGGSGTEELEMTSPFPWKKKQYKKKKKKKKQIKKIKWNKK